MHRSRHIAASPFRPAADSWQVAKDLVASTLERSTAVGPGSVATALAPLDGLATILIASGRLNTHPLTLVDGSLHADLRFINGDESFDVDENLSPIPGGATATASWKLYVLPPSHLAAAVTAACADSEHLVQGKAPAAVEADASLRSGSWQIDESALRRIGGSS